MNTQPIFLTVVIPAYQVRNYIVRCLASVLDVGMGCPFEIILVDDGSPDDSVSLAEKYLAKRPEKNITILRQENKGLGGARNTGIQTAGGQYIFFLDADDFLLTGGAMSAALTFAVEENLDIIEFGAGRAGPDQSFAGYCYDYKPTAVLSGEEYMANGRFGNSACNKLYRREFLTEHNLFFPEKTLVEDAPFNIAALSVAKRVAYRKLAPVMFFDNPESITRRKRSGDFLIKFITDSIKITENMYASQQLLTNREAKEAVSRKIGTFVAGIMVMMIRARLPRAEKMNLALRLKNSPLLACRSAESLWRTLFLRLCAPEVSPFYFIRFL